MFPLDSVFETIYVKLEFALLADTCGFTRVSVSLISMMDMASAVLA